MLGRSRRYLMKLEDWITKDCDSRRSWIGGEGIPSRDQVKVKRKHRKPQVSFCRVNPQERVANYEVCHTILEVVYAGHNGDKCTYVGLLKERCVHLEKHANIGHKEDQTLSGLCVVVFLSLGHYPYYGSPDFIIIKSCQH
jgi:hypothetical protein